MISFSKTIISILTVLLFTVTLQHNIGILLIFDGMLEAEEVTYMSEVID